MKTAGLVAAGAILGGLAVAVVFAVALPSRLGRNETPERADNGPIA